MVRARTLAASFVVTVATGCGGATPPPGGADAARPAEDAGTTPETTPEAAPPPRSDTDIERRPDGTCWEYAKVKCPPQPATCNPPPPLQVPCPE